MGKGIRYGGYLQEKTVPIVHAEMEKSRKPRGTCINNMLLEVGTAREIKKELRAELRAELRKIKDKMNRFKIKEKNIDIKFGESYRKN